MKHARFSVLLWLLLLLLVSLFVGIEEIPREHGTDYEFFTKQIPGFQLVYRNTVVCGACDVEPFETLSAHEKEKFAEFCLARFGLDDIGKCYAIFAEGQRQANVRAKINQ